MERCRFKVAGNGSRLAVRLREGKIKAKADTVLADRPLKQIIQWKDLQFKDSFYFTENENGGKKDGQMAASL